MSVSEHVRKILWSLADNACARCGAQLVRRPEAVGDPHAIVGRECRIVARSTAGPRGEAGTRENIDGVDNLILLCANCHAVVDGQTERFPPDEFRRMKHEHEQRVGARRAAGEAQPIRVEGGGGPVRLKRIDSGESLVAAVGGTEAFGYETPETLSVEERALVGDFLQNCSDWSEIYNDIGPRGHFGAAQSLQDDIDALRARELVVYAGVRHRRLTGGVGPPMPWREGLVCVARADDVREPSLSDVA